MKLKVLEGVQQYLLRKNLMWVDLREERKWAHDQYQENLKQVEVVMEKGNQWIWKNGTEGESPCSGKEKYSHEKQHLWKEKQSWSPNYRVCNP